MYFNKRIFELDTKEINTSEEVLRKLSQMFLQQGIVKESYEEAVIEREHKFPTGISFGDIGIAIPHTDTEHVLEPQIGVMTLNKPVQFTQMATTDVQVNVQVVFILALNEAHSQLDVLQKLMELLQNSSVMNEIINLKDTEQDKKILESILNKEVSN